MDSQETKTDNFELPKPTGAGGSEAGMSAPEQGSSHEQQTSASSTADPAGSAATAHHLDPAAILGTATPMATTPSAHTAGMAAEDADLIEKTWVEKAKQIVSDTRGDPYRQNTEINKVKADYIKKRYNKDIKLVSE